MADPKERKVVWYTYEEILEIVLTPKSEQTPIFLLTFWTFVSPEKLLTDLQTRFQSSKSKEEKKNILNLIQQWMSLDSSAFEIERTLWIDSLAPFLAGLLQHKRWKETSLRIAHGFLAPLSVVILEQWLGVLCAFRFDTNSTLSCLPRDVISTILSFSCELKPWPKTKFHLIRQPKPEMTAIDGKKPKKDKQKDRSGSSKKVQKKGKITAPSNLLCELDVPTLAQQLTLFEYELVSSIRPHELFCHVGKKTNFAVHVVPLIEHFDKVTSWITMSIATCEVLEKRVEVLSKFIFLLDELFQLRNLLGCMEVVAALASSVVSRLTRTWAALPKKVAKKFHHHNSFFEPTLNYKAVREFVRSNTQSLVPYFGITLQDLGFIVEGIPSCDAEGKINWYKNELVHQTLLDYYILNPYNMTKIDWVQDKINNLMSPPRNDVPFQWSLAVEPRIGVTISTRPEFVFEPY